MDLIKKLFGSDSKKEIRKISPLVEKTAALSSKYEAMSEGELQNQTGVLKGRLAAGETLDDILPDAFAVVREASTRVIGLRHYDVQIMGGIILHQGRIAEMKTGEGKTLVATLAAYLNALTGEGVHIITVNDYLAKRDSEWMGKIYRFLGLTVGLVIHDVSNDKRRAAYECDITYGTNNEFGFDYLRDNMVTYKENLVQRGHAFAIVDEVDSILIDEARTPLIISGQSDESTEMYDKAEAFVKNLTFKKTAEMDEKANYDDIGCDYMVDEKAKTALLLKPGIAKAEQHFGIENLSDPSNSELAHHINQAIKANGVMQRDVDYVVKDGEVIIVDEFTGRLMFGRRYNQGLHQAIEAKERVKVAHESKTLATITFQNYFRLYSKLSGMTGTAMTEEDEFKEIYKLDVVEIPTNRPMVRMDNPDSIYKTEKGKFEAVINQVEECNKAGQPVLVGTISIEKSELLSSMLRRRGIKHEVLNAKHHSREAEIIAQAGKPGVVTIATNMAGRGTDIMLGGNAEYAAKNQMRKEGFSEELIEESTAYSETDNEEILKARETYRNYYSRHKDAIASDSKKVVEAGGLYIIGTERHESRRIDNQLRGRAGRQGDPGSSRFYLSLEDDLMRLFGGDRITGIMNTLKIEEDQPIEAKLLSNSIESAQRKIESINFSRRKTVLDYDDVMNKQREIIYSQRKSVLDGESMRSTVLKMAHELADEAVKRFTADGMAENWDFAALSATVQDQFGISMKFEYTARELDRLEKSELTDMITQEIDKKYDLQEELNTPELMREAERMLMLRAVDLNWMQHIDAMDDLREGIGLRAYAQRNPIVEYRMESYDMFEQMVASIKEETVRYVLSVRVSKNEDVARHQVARASSEQHGEGDKKEKKVSSTVTNPNKVGRNDLCPCGSGKKYKKCCGADE